MTGLVHVANVAQLVAAQRAGVFVVFDWFCGEGGVSQGWHEALSRRGIPHLIVGFDNAPARLARYPFVGVLVDDAVPWIAEIGHLADVNAGSPPCTGYSRGTAALPNRLERYDRLIPATREAFRMAGRPYVIENVEDARSELVTPITVCWTHHRRPGSVLDVDGTPLWMRRHRVFESDLPIVPAGPCNHPPRNRAHRDWVQCAGAYGGARRNAEEARTVRKGGYVPASVDVIRALLETPWMSETGCQLSIPPFYVDPIADQVLDILEVPSTPAPAGTKMLT